jgi:predicted  nucleic acid-binding Zn-ribbon protein
MEEKHELEYKLSKTTEISQNQIKDLEDAMESFDSQMKQCKLKYEDQIVDLQKQIECMEAQIKLDKSFIESQCIEREKEREEYESKISELNDLISKKSTQFLENEDSTLNKVSFRSFFVLSFR